MRNRSLLALYTALCLLLGLTVVPSGPQLVCQMTGRAVTPAVAGGAGPRPSCCDVSAHLTADGTTRYVLTHPGCCDLRQGVERRSLPAVRTAFAGMPPAVLAVQPLPVPLPRTEEVPVPAARPRPRAARPPPRSSPESPRAPPAIS